MAAAVRVPVSTLVAAVIKHIMHIQRVNIHLTTPDPAWAYFSTPDRRCNVAAQI